MMNRWGVPFNGRKTERDEDLLLFRELHKREKDRVASLLQPVSDEFEPNGGNHTLYRIASGKKGSGYDQIFAENNKNDYDWLKTPPATPLFPSLEMEANAAEPAIQRELPITQPLSRFAGNKELPSNARINGRPKSPTPKPKIPSRSMTPSYRPTISTSSESKDTKPTLSNQKSNQPIAKLDPSNNKRRNTISSNITSKPSTQKDNHMDFLTSNLSKNLVTFATKTKPRSRGVSPLARSTIQVQGFSDETPANLKTNRSASAIRARTQPASAAAVAVGQAQRAESKHRRQSCSPSVTRGRMVEAKADVKATPILGSRMVEKLMNARKSCAEERDAAAAKHKLRAGGGGGGGYTNEINGVVRMKNMFGKR